MKDDVTPRQAVDELLRWLSPVMMTKPRFVAQDMVFEGQELRQGQKVFALLISANHDSQVFSNP